MSENEVEVGTGDYDLPSCGHLSLRTTGPYGSDRVLEAGPSVRDRWDACLDLP